MQIFQKKTGPGCSKLIILSVNVSLKFQTCARASLIFSNKKYQCIWLQSGKPLSWPLNQIIELPMLSTTGSRCALLLGCGLTSRNNFSVMLRRVKIRRTFTQPQQSCYSHNQFCRRDTRQPIYFLGPNGQGPENWCEIITQYLFQNFLF